MSQQKPNLELDVELAMRLGLITMKCPQCDSQMAQSYPDEPYWACPNFNCVDDEGDSYSFYVNDMTVKLGALA